MSELRPNKIFIARLIAASILLQPVFLWLYIWRGKEAADFVLRNDPNVNPLGSLLSYTSNMYETMTYGMIYAILVISTYVLFAIWLHRNYRNLALMGIKTSYKTHWSWFSIFIPLLSLFIPYFILKEIFQKSKKETSTFLFSPLVRDQVVLLIFWLCFAIFPPIAMNVTFRVFNSNYMAVFLQVGVWVVSALLVYLCLPKIDAQIEAKINEFNSSISPTPVQSQASDLLGDMGP